MGAAHSRRRPGGAGTNTCGKLTLGANHHPPKYGTFILSLRKEKIKVVNAEHSELKLLKVLIKKHCEIRKEGWDRHLTYSYRLEVPRSQCLIQLVADILMSLYQEGWEPMTPIEMGMKKHTVAEGIGTDICFRKMKGEAAPHGMTSGDECLCLETCEEEQLCLYNVPHTVLYEIVSTIQERWVPGIRAVSTAVASVIQDYTHNMPSVTTECSTMLTDKVIVLEGNPWADMESGEVVQVSLIACLSKEGYKLSMDINLEPDSRVLFLIKNKEDDREVVRVPNNAGAGLGEKETLSVYRPILVRHKSSFFRSYHGKTVSIRNRIRASMRRSTMTKQNTVMTYKPVGTQPAWWQQQQQTQ